MTDERLAELERLASAATAGPWFRVEPPWLPSNCTTYVIAGTPDPHGGRLVCDFAFIEDREQEQNDWDDAAFIAEARTAIPELIAEVRRLRAARNDRAAETPASPANGS